MKTLNLYTSRDACDEVKEGDWVAGRKASLKKWEYIEKILREIFEESRKRCGICYATGERYFCKDCILDLDKVCSGDTPSSRLSCFRHSIKQALLGVEPIRKAIKDAPDKPSVQKTVYGQMLQGISNIYGTFGPPGVPPAPPTQEEFLDWLVYSR